MNADSKNNLLPKFWTPDFTRLVACTPCHEQDSTMTTVTLPKTKDEAKLLRLSELDGIVRSLHYPLDPTRNALEFRLLYQGQWNIIYQNNKWARHGQALLQAALQDEIRDRGWFGMIDTNGLVSVAPVNHIAQKDVEIFYGQHEVIAIALLSAFLQAAEPQS